MIDLIGFANMMVILMAVWFFIASRLELNLTKANMYYGISKYSLIGWVIVVGICTTAWFLADKIIDLIYFIYGIFA